MPTADRPANRFGPLELRPLGRRRRLAGFSVLYYDLGRIESGPAHDAGRDELNERF